MRRLLLVGGLLLPSVAEVARLRAVAEVPEPRPVATQVRVGCYYFPGFFHAARWSPMKDYGSPVPLLGYYRDGAPDVSDWHIKWALENGISFFVFDWYYDYRTGRVGEHNTALEEGFLKAKYRDRMEFCIFWCNEEPEREPYTEEQMLTLGRVLGERYFGCENYLRLEGRPVLFISVPQRLQDSFGRGFRDLLPRISAAAGLPEGTLIYLVAQLSGSRSHQTSGAALKEMGFAACTAYNYAGVRASDAGSALRAPYPDMIEGYEKMWRQVTADGSLPYLVPVSPGWDSRPWYGPRAFVRTDPSPAKFREMCERAKQYVDPRLNLVIAECWNEFGEGSYLEPCQGFEFGYLNALRDAFGVGGDYPPNVAPTPEQMAASVFHHIPPDPQFAGPGRQEGNLILNPGFEEDGGWLNYEHGPVRLSEDHPHTGRRCLTVRPGEGAKSWPYIPLVFGRTYEIAAWVRGAPGAEGNVRSALFDPQGNWLGSYLPIGLSTSTDWTRVATTVRAVDLGVGGLNLEFTAHGGDVFADDVSLTVIGAETVDLLVYADECESADGWVTLEGNRPIVEPNGHTGAALHVPAGGGIKTTRLFPAGPGMTYGLRLWLRCEEMATVEVRAPEVDAAGTWLRRYVVGGQFSWQEWIEITCVLRFPSDSQAAQCPLEVVSQGGGAWIDDVRLYRGEALLGQAG